MLSNASLLDNIDLKNCLILFASLNKNVSSYEFGDFGGVYELRDFARLLSMNYSDLVGNIYSKEYDLYVDDTYKGKNLGKKIKIDEKIRIDTKTGAVVLYDGKSKEYKHYQIVIIDDHTKDAIKKSVDAVEASLSKKFIDVMNQFNGA